MFRLLELTFRHGARDDTRPDVEMDPVLAKDGGADRDRGVEVAVVAEIPHGSAVQPAPLAFGLGDELHRPDLRRARERSRREDAAQSVERVQARLQPRFHVAHQMKDVAVALHLHVLSHGHRPRPGHSTQVVATQIHEHHVLRPLLGIALQGVGQGIVLERSRAARPRPSDRVSGDAVALDPNEQLRARPHDRELRHPDEVEVRARVDASQRAIERDRVERLTADDRAFVRLATSDDDLDGLAGGNRLLGRPHGRFVLASPEADFDLAQAGGRRLIRAVLDRAGSVAGPGTVQALAGASRTVGLIPAPSG